MATSKLDDILHDTGSTLFCKGQDWKPGDGSASEVDGIVDKAKQRIKDLMLELIGEDEDPDRSISYANTQACNIMKHELRWKVEEL